jgi:acyl dehydratase
VRILTSIDQVEALIGEPLGATEWTPIEQPAVDTFADLTGDHQWIHVDADRASESTFGGTIVHGLLTLGMLPGFGLQLFRIEAGSARLNYGLDTVRFPAPLRTGTRVRGVPTFLSVTPVASGTQVRTRWSVEAEGVERPVCVAEAITLVLP